MKRKKLLKICFLLELQKAFHLAKLINSKKIKKKRCAVRENLKCRRKEGAFHNLIPRMRLHDIESFKNFHRMDPATFDELLSVLGPHIRKIPTQYVQEISAAEKLAVTLRYLASGDSMKSIGVHGFRIGASTTTYIIKETCQLISQKLEFTFPTLSMDMWEEVSNDFFSMWDFPNCIGAVDGKHVMTYEFPNPHSFKFNYKKSRTLVLMAVVDAKYKFLLIDIGAKERYDDGDVFSNSKFGSAILHNPDLLKLPQTKELPGTNINVPYVFLGDEAFPLSRNLMRPYAGQNIANLSSKETVFNCYLSKARSVVENAFGILSSRFRIYRKPIIVKKETAENIIKATICLHNWLLDKSSSGYFCADNADRYNDDGSVVPGVWRSFNAEALKPLQKTSSNSCTQKAIVTRQIFTDFFK